MNPPPPATSDSPTTKIAKKCISSPTKSPQRALLAGLQQERGDHKIRRAWVRTTHRPEKTPEQFIAAQYRVSHAALTVIGEGEKKEGDSSVLFSAPNLRSQILEDMYETPKGAITERVTRYSVVEQDEEICKKMIAFLTRQPGREAELAYYRNQLKIGLESPAYEKGWVDSNATRNVLKSAPNFKEGTDGYLAAPVNARYHEIEGLGGLVRLGVISDMTQGWVSLHDLKHPENLSRCSQEVEKQIKSPKNPSFQAKIRRKVGIKVAPMKEGSKMHQSAIQAREFIRKCQEPNFRKEALALRRACLEKQMLHLVLAQVEKHPEALQNGSLDLVHLSLLNPRSATIDETGWMHNEQKELEDMREIFAEFQGKKIVFDGTGPFIEGETIHLPPSLGTGGEAIKLNTYFFNVCPQNNDRNEGIQLETNRAQWEKLQQQHSLPLELRERLLNPQTKSDFDLAASLLSALMDSHAAVSTGCLSAKDRTSFAIALAFQKWLARTHYTHQPNPHRDRPLHPDSVGSRVINENTPGVRIPKVNPLEVGESVSTTAKAEHAFRFVMQHALHRRYS